MDLNEHETRGQLIDRQLEKAGWKLDDRTQVRRERTYEVILANPPFKGAIDATDVNPSLPSKVKKTEVLFLHLFLRLLENGGRAAVIVPDGVLFGSSKAHIEIRRTLIEENRLDGVVSMPSGVFRPYAGVSTAVLLFTKGAATERVWFYDMERDGFSLDDKRQPKPGENDIPDVLTCWSNRNDAKFQKRRDARLAELLKQIAPLKQERLARHALIHRLTFESVIAESSGGRASPRAAELATADRAAEAPAEYRVSPTPSPNLRKSAKSADNSPAALLSSAEADLAALDRRIAPLQQEINQLTRQFWVDKSRIVEEDYDLSASRYRQLEQDEVFYENPAVTLERLRALEQAAEGQIETLEKMVASAD